MRAVIDNERDRHGSGSKPTFSILVFSQEKNYRHLILLSGISKQF